MEGLLAPAQRILIIEQPEIHLHPKMQAELADFLIDVANIKKTDKAGERQEIKDKDKRAVLVETHSEYLLNRVRRRISDGDVSHSDVAIYFVEPSDSGAFATVRGVNVPANGAFEWPKEFYERDLEDSIEYLKNIGRGPKK